MRRRRVHPGFTLLELVLVMLVIGTVLALAAPSLSGFHRGGKLRDAGDQLLSIIRYARAQAIVNARTYRLSVDGANYQLTRQSAQDFVALGNDFGQPFTLPEGFSLELTDAQNKPLDHVDFYPNGRVEPARFRIASADGASATIQSTAPAEPFALVGDTGGAP